MDQSPKGIYNIGNTCYLNSALQCLFNDKNFMFYLSKFGNIDEFIDTFLILYNNRRVIDIMKLKQLLANKNDFFEGNNQKDCHEALITIKDIVHKIITKLDMAKIDANKTLILKTLNNVNIPVVDTKRLGPNELELSRKSYEIYKKNFGFSFVNYLYTGQFVSVMCCNTCNTNRYSFETFDELMVNIDIGIESNIGAYVGDTRDMCDMYKCFYDYIKEETIDDIECDHCSAKNKQLTKTSISKITTIWNFPRKLTFVLKRFINDRRNNTNVVINNNLEFKTKDGLFKYQLKTVVNHIGPSIDKGHYVTDNYVTYPDGSQIMYRIDDDIVIALDQNWINQNRLSSSAYIVEYDLVK